jgi:transcriptional regulator
MCRPPQRYGLINWKDWLIAVRRSEQMDVSDKKLTTREKIIRCLEAEPMTARDLSKALRISEKDAYSHLPSIKKSIKHQGKLIKIMPCYCLNCGFEFKDRKSFKKPGK